SMIKQLVMRAISAQLGCTRGLAQAAAPYVMRKFSRVSQSWLKWPRPAVIDGRPVHATQVASPSRHVMAVGSLHDMCWLHRTSPERESFCHNGPPSTRCAQVAF